MKVFRAHDTKIVKYKYIKTSFIINNNREIILNLFDINDLYE